MMTSMPQNQSQQKPVNRPADTLVQKSEERVGAMALISRAQVKLWKAMLVTLFVSGFVAALAFVIGVGLGDRSDAATRSGSSSKPAASNLASKSKVISSSFASRGGDWSQALDDNTDPAGAVIWNSKGIGAPYVELQLPDTKGHVLQKLGFEVDPNLEKYRLCGLREFELLGSNDRIAYQSLVKGVKQNSAGVQWYPISNSSAFRYVKILFRSNWGDKNYTCVKNIIIL